MPARRWWTILAAACASCGVVILLAGRGGSESPDALESAASPSSPAREEQGPLLEGTAPSAPPVGTRFRMRLANARGNPLAYAWVRVKPRAAGLGGPRVLYWRVQADETGLVDLEVEAPLLDGVDLEVAGLSQAVSVVTWRGGADPAEVASRLLTVETVDMVYGRTQGATEQGIHDQRLLYRVLDSSVASPGAWLRDRSQAGGWFVLGPFPRESTVEVALAAPNPSDLEPVPQGEVHRGVPGGEPLVLVVSEPTVRLRVEGVAPDAEIPVGHTALGWGRSGRVRLQDGVTGWGRSGRVRLQDGMFEIEGPLPRHGVDVVVGPLEDGRCCRARNVLPEQDPIPISLEPGDPFRGRATVPGGTGKITGTAFIMGAGWAVQLSLADDGSFAFPGVPSGGAHVLVEAIDQDRGQRYVGTQAWSGGGPADVALVPAVVLAGRIRLEEAVDPAYQNPILELWTEIGGRLIALADDGHFRAFVPHGFVMLNLVTSARDHGVGIRDQELLRETRLKRDLENLDLPAPRPPR